MGELIELYQQFAQGFGIEGVAGQIGILIFVIFTIFKGLKFVREGQRGLKLRFGKVVRDRSGAPKVIEPGFVFLIPYVVRS